MPEEEKIDNSKTNEEKLDSKPVKYEDNDWVQGRLYGGLPKNYADILKNNPDGDYSLKDKDEYWEDDNIKSLFEETYGKDAAEEYDRFYEGMVIDYNNYAIGNYDSTDYEDSHVPLGMGHLIGLPEAETFNATQTVRRKTIGGAQQYFDMFTNHKRSARKVAIDSEKAYDLKGNEYKVQKDPDSATGMLINGIPADDFLNEDGEKIMGLYYDPKSLDPNARVESSMVLGFDGEYSKTAKLTPVQGFDMLGWTDPKLESSAVDKIAAVPKGIWNSAASLLEGGAALGATASHFAGFEETKKWFEGTQSTFAASQFSMSDEAAADNWGAENLLTQVGSLAGQIGSGVAIGKISSAVAGKLLKSAATASKIGSSTNMFVQSTVAAKDSRREAFANGLNENEAGTMYIATLGVLGLTQKFTRYTGKAFSNSQLIKEASKHIKSTMPYVAGTFTKGAKEGENRVKDAALKQYSKSLFTKMKGSISSIRSSDGMGAGFVEESFEEMLEHTGESSVKQAFNLYVASGMAGREYGKEGKGRYKDVTDKGYWAEFGEGLALSGVLGGIGGAGVNSKIGKRIFFGRTPEDSKFKNVVINSILDGNGEAYLSELDRAHKNGELGPKDLSIEMDTEGKYFKPYKEGAQGNLGINMNDGNLNILRQEYNYIQSVLTGLNVKGNVRKLLDDNPKLVEQLEETNLISDVKGLVNDYLHILEKNDDLAVENIKVPKEDISEEDREESIEKQANKAGMSIEDTKEIIAIKEKLNSIQDGTAASKYYMESMVSGTELDKNHPEYEKNYGYLGDDALYNLMEASHQTSLERQSHAKDVKIKIDKNSDAVKSLDKDLSNIDEVSSTISTGGNLYLSESSREYISNQVKNYKLPSEDMKSVKRSLEEKVADKKLYDIDRMKAIPSVSEMFKNNPDIKEQLEALMPAYYNERLQSQISNVSTLNDLNNFQIEQPGDIINELNNSLDDNIGDAVLRNITKMLKSMTPAEADSFGKRLGSMVGNNTSEHDYNAPIKSIKEFDSNVFSTIETANNNFNKLVELNSKASLLPEESSYAYDPTNTDFLLNDYIGNDKGIKDVNRTLNDDVVSLETQFEKDITPTGKSTFNNLVETREALNKVNSRLSQISILQDMSNGLAELRIRQNKISKRPSDSSNEILNTNSTKSEVEKYSRMFNGTLYNPVLLSQLINKDVKTLTQEEVDLLKEMQLTQGSMVQSANLLKGYRDRLESLEKEAIKNKDLNKSEVVHKESRVRVTKDNIEVLSELFDMSSVNQEDEAVKEFKSYYGTEFSDKKTSEEDIAKDFNIISKARDYLFNLDDKPTLLKEYNTYLTEGNTIIIKESDRHKLAQVATAMEFDINNFYGYYKTMVANMEHAPTATQEEVAIATTAHLTTDLSGVLAPYLDVNNNTKGLSNMIFVSGVGGSGKSTMVTGVGAKIAQEIITSKYGKDKSKVLLASNSEDQVDILNSTATNSDFNITTKNVGTDRGVVLNDLIELLESGKGLEDVSTIIYDEATFIPYRDESNSKPYQDKSELAKIEERVLKINNKRLKDGDMPMIKLVLMGDPGQNGNTNSEDGVPENISAFEKKIYMTPTLTHSHRSNISEITDALELINRSQGFYTGGNSLNNIKTSYGKIKGRSDDLMGGVRFADIFNDKELLDNVEKQIELSSDTDKPFKVGVVTTESTDKTELGALIKKYPKNFRVRTHIGVQGQEFDYVLSSVTKEDIGNSNMDWKSGSSNNYLMEHAASNKLSTTISRARYFAVVHNKTQRIFKSESVDNITVPAEIDLEGIAARSKESLVNMIPVESIEFDITGEPTQDQQPKQVDSQPTQVSEIEPTQQSIKVNNNKLKEVATIESMRSLEELPVKDIKGLIKVAESNDDFIEIKRLNDQLIVSEFDNKDLEVPSKITEEENELLGDALESMSNEEARDIQIKIEAIDGEVGAYTHLTEGNSNKTPYQLDVERLSSIYDPKDIAEESDYQSIKLRAMNLSKGSKRSDFEYKLVVYKDTSNNNSFQKVPGSNYFQTQVMLVATDLKNKKGKKVNMGSILTGEVIKNGLVGSSIVKEGRRRLNIEGSNYIEYSMDNPKSIISNISDGKIVRGSDSKTLKEFRLNKIPGVTVSKDIFVTTNDSRHRGEAFLFYTFNNKKHDLSDVDSLLDTVPDMWGKNDVRSGIKDGLGFIRLDSKGHTFSELFDMIDSTTSRKARSLTNIVNSNKGQGRMVNAFATISHALQSNRKTLLGRDNTIPNPTIEEILSESEYTQFEDRNEVYNILKDLKKTKDGKEMLDFLDYFMTEIFNKGRTGSSSVDSVENGGGIRVGTYKNTGENFPYAKDAGPDIITFLGKSLIEKTHENPVSTYRFNLMQFFETMQEATEGDTVKFKRVLSIFDDILSKSSTYGKRNSGQYLRAQKVGRGRTNREFSVLNTVLNMENSYMVNVDNITTPIVYLDGASVLSIIKGEVKTEGNVEDQVEIIEERDAQGMLITDRISNINKSIGNARDLIEALPNKSFTSTSELDEEIYEIEDGIGTLVNIVSEVTDAASKSLLNKRVADIKKRLKRSKTAAYKNSKVAAPAIDSLDASMAKVEENVTEVINTVDPEVESQMLSDLRSEMLSVYGEFKTLGKFIFSPVDLANFKSDLSKVLKSSDAEISKMVDEGTVSLAAVDKLAVSMEAAVNTLNTKVGENHKDLVKSIADNMSSYFESSDLESIIEQDTDLEGSDLKQLLVSYHLMKNNEESTKEIEKEINSRYILTGETTDQEINNVLSPPLVSMEDIKNRLKVISKMFKDKSITKTQRDESMKSISSRVKEVKNIEKITKLGVTKEVVESMNDGDVKTLLTSSMISTLDDSISPEAKEIFERTWEPVRRSLSWKVDAQHIQDTVSSKLIKTIDQVTKQYEYLKLFVLDSDKISELDKEFNSMIEEARNSLSKKQDDYAEAKDSVDTTIASDENPIPTFFNEELAVNLSPEARSVLLGLDSNNKNTLNSLLNGELNGNLSSLDAQTKLYDQLEELVGKDLLSDKLMDQVETYIENKIQDKICKK